MHILFKCFIKSILMEVQVKHCFHSKLPPTNRRIRYARDYIPKFQTKFHVPEEEPDGARLGPPPNPVNTPPPSPVPRPLWLPDGGVAETRKPPRLRRPLSSLAENARNLRFCYLPQTPFACLVAIPSLTFPRTRRDHVGFVIPETVPETGRRFQQGPVYKHRPPQALCSPGRALLHGLGI